MMKYDIELEEINKAIIKKTNGAFQIMPSIPSSLISLVPKTVLNFWCMPKNLQRLQQMGELIQGRVGPFIYQSSHGVQQIKFYQPWIYNNERNTPLRIRARTIIQLAAKEPVEKRKDKVRELYKTLPYNLLINEPVKLRMKNFHFDKSVAKGDLIKIYRAADPEQPDPESDILYTEKEYGEKRTVLFEYQGEDEQHIYAVNTRNQAISNVLHFIWREEIEFSVKEENKKSSLDKMVEVLEMMDGFDKPKAIFKKTKYTEKFVENLDKRKEEEKKARVKEYIAMITNSQKMIRGKQGNVDKLFIKEMLKENKRLTIVTEDGVYGGRKKKKKL